MKKLFIILSIATLIGCSKDDSDNCKYSIEEVEAQYEAIFEQGAESNPNFYNSQQYYLLLQERDRKLDEAC